MEKSKEEDDEDDDDDEEPSPSGRGRQITIEIDRNAYRQGYKNDMIYKNLPHRMKPIFFFIFRSSKLEVNLIGLLCPRVEELLQKSPRVEDFDPPR